MKRVAILFVLLLFVLPGVLFSQPTLYGLTPSGGQGTGTIIQYESATNALTSTFNFPNSPLSPVGLVQASNGKLYGMTSAGGTSDSGVIYSFDPATNTRVDLVNFNSSTGGQPGGCMLLASNGKLYGMTSTGGSNGAGTIFTFNPSTNKVLKLFDFNGTNGANPIGNLIQATNKKLYGMTTYGGSHNFGTIFSFDLVTNTQVKLFDFDSTNGAYPFASLVQASNGKLYGTTLAGGIYGDVYSGGYGTIFSFDPVTNTHLKLIDFNQANGASPVCTLIQANNGKLYGTTYLGGLSYYLGDPGAGTIFSFSTDSNVFTTLFDFDLNNDNGAFPGSGFVQAGNGKLYGMTSGGGAAGYGTIFSFDPSSNLQTRLLSFNLTNGGTPNHSLIQATNGKLYGTASGGTDQRGILFSFDPATNAQVDLNDFKSQNGYGPAGGLVQAANGKYYGVTSHGGTGVWGTIFSYDASANTQANLYNFNGANGSSPLSSLVMAGNGKFYGTTFMGGNGDYGTIFSFDPTTNAQAKLFDFNYGVSGAYAHGSLVQAGNGKLYGMAQGGGSGGLGTIYSFDPSTNTFAKLFDFNGTNGSIPYGSLVQATNGKLYGMTYQGGANNFGTLFSFDPATNTQVKLIDFNTAQGTNPTGSLIQASNGKLYGMTYGGGSGNYGVIFSFDPSTNTLVKLFDFDNTRGAYPFGSLVQASNGKLYGMTWSGGSTDRGVVFSYDITGSSFLKLQNFNWANGANPSFDAHFTEKVCVNANVNALTTTNITASGATLNWTAPIDPTQWQVQYKPTIAGTAYTSVLLSGDKRSLSISSLLPNQAYTWRIRAKCGKTFTAYTATAKFTTLATGLNAIAFNSINEAGDQAIRVYPNPARGQFTLSMHIADNTNAIAKILLVDMVGKKVLTDNATMSNGALQKTISTPAALAGGLYIVSVIVNQKTYMTQVIIEK
ncbi:MAG TPA: T9SS type A sorting domain-containing protein [Panacibacter sp.]|nr:T9SS type A sorting domain-containing protein [Panacibacter sp.]